MADPFSIAGSAVGIASLGLTVTQGLVGYYTSYAAYDEEITETVGTIRRLGNIFALLKDVLLRPSPENARFIAQIQSCVASCEDGVKGLQAHLDKCRPAPSAAGNSSEMRKFLDRSLLPFRRKVLNELRDSVEKLRDHLMLAITVLKLALSDKHSSDLTTLVGASISTAIDLGELKRRITTIETQVGNIQTALTPVGNAVLAMAPVVRDTLPKVQEEVSALYGKASLHASALADINCTMQSLRTDFGPHLPAIETKIDQLPNQLEARFIVTLETQLQQFVNVLSARTVLDYLVDRHVPLWVRKFEILGSWSESYRFSLIASLVDLGIDWAIPGAEPVYDPANDPVYDPVDLIKSLETFEELAERTQNGKLSTAILSRSQEEIDRLLHPSSGPLDERNVFGHTPLHLTADQPETLALLLTSGFVTVVDDVDIFGFPAAVHSGFRGNLAALRLLLDADCALYSSSDIDILHLAIEYSWHDGILQTLIDELADRRKRLQELASDNLTPAVLEGLNLPNRNTLDEQAHSVCQALECSGVHVPAAVRVPDYRTTVYHEKKELMIDQADKLYGAGFCDVDGLDVHGWTPLARTRLRDVYSRNEYKLALWLLEKGANLTAELPDLPGRNDQEKLGIWPWTTPAHIWGSHLGDALVENQDYHNKTVTDSILTGTINLPPVSHDEQRLLATILEPRIFDKCRCACSSSGCSPAAVFMKRYKEQLRYRRLWVWHGCCPESTKEYFLRSLDALHRSLIERLATGDTAEQKVSIDISLELIRLETFEKLQLTHTCCKGDHFPCDEHFEYRIYSPTPDEAEVDEIQEEERKLIARLDVLVAEFDLEFNKRQESLLDFLDGYWTRRMEEVLAAADPVDEEAIRRAESIGVKIER
ncbi:hypothetical protein H2201_006006 [Coniosporium apollinis]|uniref:Fungal N-terminal domain-containing protein n=1 Tax=Coniosporium apollinis TaxID=61459 RepID=A0ABQ9NS31_9PEZI|nr:hypothetical protein H2201_006006 [Coniosporium apollinis]